MNVLRTETSLGFGPARRTRKSAQREADAWTASGSGTRYLWNNPEGIVYTPDRPTYFETCVTEVRPTDDGGFICTYITTREFIEA